MRIYLSALLVLAVMLAAHTIGNAYGLYVSIWYYDIFMHILGGLGIGLTVIAVQRSHPLKLADTRGRVVFVVFVIGVVWELFEAYFDIAGYPVGTKLYWLDTIKDLTDDVIGAFIAAYIIS